MRVLLIKPANLSDHIQPSLGLGYLANQIRNDHDVKILDCLKERVEGQQLLPFLEEFKPDLVGSQCYSMDLPKVRNILQTVKDFDKSIVTIVGGAHPTGLPKETMKLFGRNLLDFVFVGEGEIGFPKLLRELEKADHADFNSVPGLGWMNDGELRINQGTQVEDLDSLGMPAWNLIEPDKYPFSPHGVVCMNYPIAPIMATRGCPYHCTFCSTAGTRLRKRSVESVREEVLLLYNQYGIREFHIVDDNFTLDLGYAKALIKDLLKLNLKASWATPNGVRLDRLDEEILHLMKELGFYSIAVGIESGSERIRRKMKKGSTLQSVRNQLQKVSKVKGIDITGFFIIGFPTETREDIEQTLRFARELPLHRAAFHSFIPLPGAEIWREMEREGELSRVDWDRYFFWARAYVPRGMTLKELKRLHRKAFFLFYLRPHIILYNLKFLQRPRVLWYAVKYLLRRLHG